MSIQTTRTGVGHQMYHSEKCTHCGDGLFPPYLAWTGKSDFFLCGPCGEQIKDGLIADLVHLAAVVQLQRHLPGTDMTLVRQSVRKLEAE
jgi:hypothetical protein